jgi:hypothetical protein
MFEGRATRALNIRHRGVGVNPAELLCKLAPFAAPDCFGVVSCSLKR